MSAQQKDAYGVQFNLGSDLRVAGRDYHECRVPVSLKVYLATTAADRLDEEAIDNERLFYDRFGIDVPRATREKVIAIKRQHGLSDAECRRLRGAGQLRITRDDARLVPDRWVPAAGWFYAAVLSVAVSVMLLATLASNAPSWKQALATLLLVSAWMGVIGLIHRCLLEPARWIRPLDARRHRQNDARRDP
jgi:hypothetical protein